MTDALTDEEVDVLAFAEELPSFDGAYRLAAPPFVLAPGELAYSIALALRDADEAAEARSLAMLTTMPHAARVLIFDPRVGAPTPLRRAVALALSPFDRKRAQVRREAREAEVRRLLEGAWEPVADPFPARGADVIALARPLSPCARSPGRCAIVTRDVRGPAMVRPRERVLLVDAEATLALPLRHALRAQSRITHLRSRWEALERLAHQPYDRIFVVERDELPEGEPSSHRFYRAATALWPQLERRFVFVVDEARAARMAERGLGERFVVRSANAVATALRSR